ncbi:ornithine cyclodeaminase [Dethiosulfatibacter aminovorans DSM 17477]|uniref:Ornithine cyclodeaminase n=1 Tax=Dethiosulfatibacter aminovorans DSM 17477 TaxID=1121476 RepID=A0A1M6MQH1_9FIRM|nr:ornithine cyclodeaminase family protein [Dethiosulfatibacter aminovorans]SHJ85721.1 ornithine cyclodeaminase [Dethiosulfatibacter aminovorans DSM 17477]
MLLLNREDIKRVFSMEDAIESVKQSFVLYSDDKTENPLRTNIRTSKHDGTLLFMPTYAEDTDYASLKIINIYPKNMDKGIPTSFAQVVLIDARTGDIVAILDGTYVTQLRTGAASGACFDILGRKDAKVGALIGTGGQAATQLEAMLSVRKLDLVKVYDCSYERTKAFVDTMSKELKGYNTKIVACLSADEVVEDADFLITVTPSRKPVFDASKCKEGITVSCVGSYQPDMQEMDPQILARAGKIFTDSQSAVLEESGDIIIPMNEGVVSEKDLTGELGALLSGRVKGREDDEEIIVFKTVGIGIQDLMTAKAVYEKAIDKGIGTNWK